MSQLAPVRPLPRTSPRRAAPTPRQLKVVAPAQLQGNGLFLVMCAVLLLGGFVGVLMLNTAMAKGSYTMRDLQRRSDALTDTQDSLRHSIDRVSGPGPLAQRARALGMVPAATPAFLRLADGKVLGVAKKAKDDSTFSVVTESATPTRSTPVAKRPTTTGPAATPSAATGTSPGATAGTTPENNSSTTTRDASPSTTEPTTTGTTRGTTTTSTKPGVVDPAPAR
jgi:hypothetical protein